MSQQNVNMHVNIELHEVYNHLKPNDRLYHAIYITCLMSEEQVKKLVEHCETILENPEYRKRILDSVNKQENV